MPVKKDGGLLPFLLLSPSLLLIALFLIIPLGFALYISFFRADYMQIGRFVGLGNYINILTDNDIPGHIGRTFYISILGVVIAVIGGIIFALWINRESKHLAFVLQIIVLIPWVSSMVVTALLWKWILNDDLGLLKYVLSSLFGIKDVGFLTNPKIAIYTLIFIMTWRVVGYVMVQALAGLRSISEDLEEAAVIDGANKWNLFWRIRLPLIATPVVISSIIVVLSNINNLIVPLSLTGGGPGKSTMVIAIEIYRQSFTYYHFGEASALSIILVAINVIFTILYLKAVKYEL
jgi:ABC-type sugar transport system permease subunit